MLLGTNLGWEQMRPLTTPPIGEVISPLGHALNHADQSVRDAAFQVLDNMVDIPAGEVLIGEELTPLWVAGIPDGSLPGNECTVSAIHSGNRDIGQPQSWEDGVYPEKKGDHPPVVAVSCEDGRRAYAAWTG